MFQESENVFANPFNVDFTMPEMSFEQAEKIIDGKISALSPYEDMLTYLGKFNIGSYVKEKVSRIGKAFSVVGGVMSSVAKAGFIIVKQSLKIAVFKFALEFFAMSIKTIVESMVSLSIKPPNIDTAGVFYNFPGVGSMTGVAPASSPSAMTGASSSMGSMSRNSRMDNPFADSPFGTAPQW